MKKTFLIFGMATCLSLVNGINNANALTDKPKVTVTPQCPAGCTSILITVDGADYFKCVKTVNGNVQYCGNGEPTGFVISAINADDYDIVNVSDVNIVEKVEKAKPVSARSAQTPKMVKKVVYEQVMEDEE